MGKQSTTHLITLEMSGDTKTLHTELNTVAAVSIILEKTHNNLFGDIPLQRCPIALKTYMGEHTCIAVSGQRMVQVRYGSQEHTLSLTAADGNGSTLLG